MLNDKFAAPIKNGIMEERDHIYIKRIMYEDTNRRG